MEKHFQAGKTACTNKGRREQPGMCTPNSPSSPVKLENWVEQCWELRLENQLVSDQVLFCMQKKHLPIANASESPMLLIYLFFKHANLLSASEPLQEFIALVPLPQHSYSWLLPTNYQLNLCSDIISEPTPLPAQSEIDPPLLSPLFYFFLSASYYMDSPWLSTCLSSAFLNWDKSSTTDRFHFLYLLLFF